jgi:hypothetical protein
LTKTTASSGNNNAAVKLLRNDVIVKHELQIINPATPDHSLCFFMNFPDAFSSANSKPNRVFPKVLILCHIRSEKKLLVMWGH